MPARSDTEWHALDAPFLPITRWQPIPGTCSRCGQPALRGVTRWWHTGQPCTGRGLPANFLPD